MPYNGSGAFSKYYTWADDEALGTPISPNKWDRQENDFRDGLSSAVTKDGQTAYIANQPMGGYKFTSVDDPTARTNYESAGCAQDGVIVYAGTAGGTANALTLSPSITPSSYVAGSNFLFKGASGNTDETTLAVDDLAAKDLLIDRLGFADIAHAGDIKTGGIYKATYNGSEFVRRGIKHKDGSIASVYDGDYFDVSGIGTSTQTFSVWVKLNSNSTVQDILLQPGVGFDLRHQGSTDNKFRISGYSASHVTYSNSAYTASSGWIHILIARNGGTPQVYINDSLQTSTDTSGSTGGSQHRVGHTNADYSLSELHFHDEYLNLSTTSNRRKFIDASGDPVFLGNSGQLPHSTTPEIYAPDGCPAVFNKGTKSVSGSRVDRVDGPNPL